MEIMGVSLLRYLAAERGFWVRGERSWFALPQPRTGVLDKARRENTQPTPWKSADPGAICFNPPVVFGWWVFSGGENACSRDDIGHKKREVGVLFRGLQAGRRGPLGVTAEHREDWVQWRRRATKKSQS